MAAYVFGVTFIVWGIYVIIEPIHKIRSVVIDLTSVRVLFGLIMIVIGIYAIYQRCRKL